MKALLIIFSIVIGSSSFAVKKNSLPNAKMNAVVQISNRVLMSRAQNAIMSSAELNCIADMPEYHLSNIRVEAEDTYFSRVGTDIFFNFEVRVRAQLGSFPASPKATVVFRVHADVDEDSPNRHTLLLGISFERIDPSVDIPELAGFITLMGEMIAINVPAPVRVPMDNALLTDITLQGNPELAIVGGNNESSPTLAIGLQLSGGDDVDRAHFRSAYAEHLLTDEDDDWCVQIEATIMKKLVQETSSEIKDDFDDQLGSWQSDFSVDDFDGYWVREARSVDYKDFGDYVNAHDDEHPFWFIAKATYTFTQCVSATLVPIPGVPRKCFDVDVGGFGFAYADLEFRGSGADKMVVVDPYFWRIDATNPMFSWAIQSQTYNPAAVPVTSAHITQDLEIMRFNFALSKLSVFGRDNFHTFSGRPTLEVNDEISAAYISVFANFSTATKTCTAANNEGELFGGYVIGKGEICNTGSAPLSICDVSITNDPDGRFKSTMDSSSPTVINPGDCLFLGIGMKEVAGDYQWHYATLTIRSNDPDRPVVNVDLSGVRSSDTKYFVCTELPFYMNHRVLRQDILDKIAASFKKDLPTLTKDFGLPVFPPEPPVCPECGYYLEMLLESTANVNVTTNPNKNPFVEQASFGQVNFLSLPLKSLSKMQVSFTPDTLKAQSRLLLGVKSIEHVGTYDAKEKILGSLCLTDCFVLTDKSLKKFKIADGGTLREVANLTINQPGELIYRFGKLLVVGKDFIASADPKNFERLESNVFMRGKSVVIGKDQIIVFDADSVTSHVVRSTGLLRVSRASLKGIVNIAQTQNGFVVLLNSGKSVKAMLVRTLDEAGLNQGVVLKQGDVESIQKQIRELSNVTRATFSTEGYLLIPSGETKVTVVKKSDRTREFSNLLKRSVATPKATK